MAKELEKKEAKVGADVLEMKIGEVHFKCGYDFRTGSLFEGGCGEIVKIPDAYRCSDCTAYFHRSCIRNHFNQIPLEQAMAEMADWTETLKKILAGKKHKFEQIQALVWNVVDLQVKKRIENYEKNTPKTK